MDTISKSQRSHNMSRIKSKDTGLEILVRKKLFQAGIRYRLHSKKFIGRPDIIIQKYKLIIDIRGCFWHGHENCKFASSPKSNTSYWSNKIIKNKERDIKNVTVWRAEGFNVFIIWECETKIEKTLYSKVAAINDYIKKKKLYLD